MKTKSIRIHKLYSVWSDGRIFSHKNDTWLKPSAYGGDNGQYIKHDLRFVPGKRNCVYAHRIVIETFCGSAPFPNMEVAHLDGNPRNNRIENLRWVYPKENQAMRRLHGTHIQGEQIPWHRLKEPQVKKIKSLLKEGMKRKDIAKRFGVSRDLIGYIARGQTWRHIE